VGGDCLENGRDAAWRERREAWGRMTVFGNSTAVDKDPEQYSDPKSYSERLIRILANHAISGLKTLNRLLLKLLPGFLGHLKGSYQALARRHGALAQVSRAGAEQFFAVFDDGFQILQQSFS
jgi:hypothetical protein